MAMTNEEITKEFETLFGGDDPEPENTDEPETGQDDEASDNDVPEDTGSADDENEGDSEESKDDSEGQDDNNSDDSSEDKKPEKSEGKQSKQNFAFAQQRQQIKEQNEFLKSIGKLIGMGDAKPEEIREKVKEALLEKQSKEQGIPVEMLQRLDRAEALLAENERIKQENEVQSTFANLIEKHHLSQEEVTEFTNYLIENNKNPMMDKTVDIESEYLKLHYDDMIKAAVDAALEKEHKRQNKVKEKAGTKTPDSHDKSEGSIDSVKDLDALFDKLEI